MSLENPDSFLIIAVSKNYYTELTHGKITLNDLFPINCELFLIRGRIYDNLIGASNVFAMLEIH